MLINLTEYLHELKMNTLRNHRMVCVPKLRMLFCGLWTNKRCGCLTLAHATSFKLGQHLWIKDYFSFVHMLKSKCTGWMHPQSCVSVWEGKCLHLFAVEGRRWLILMAPVTCHCFCHKQLPVWIQRERGRCIVAETCAEKCQNAIKRYSFKKHEVGLNRSLEGGLTTPFFIVFWK